MRHWCGVLGAFLGVFGTTSAQAQVEERRSYSIERFRLSLDSDGMFDVEWAEVPPHLAWDVAVLFGYENDPLVTRRIPEGGTAADDDKEVVARLVDNRTSGGIVAAISLYEWVQLGLDIPIIFNQQRDSQQPDLLDVLPDISSAGIGDLRVVPKIRILRQQEHHVGVAFMPAFTLPTGPDDAYMGDGGATFVPELLVSRSFGSLRFAGGLGFRFRPSESLTSLSLEVANEFFFRLGGGYSFEEQAKIPLELDLTLSSAGRLNAFLSEGQETSVEILGGASYRFIDMLSGFLAFGAGLSEGYGTPEWRMVLGVRVSQHNDDRDKDGIRDSDDQCPDEPEDKDGFEDLDGCPDPDNDQDLVPDVHDGAPNIPEDRDGYADDDGIPDPDNDQDGLLDEEDACPNEAGPKAQQGCPDRDADGVPDSADKCPSNPEDKDDFEDEDGCPELDNDQDGIVDAADACPNEPGPVENKGCPDTDRDGDTVVDRLDNCPDEPGPPENHGCKEKQLVLITSEKLEILETVHFNTNSHVIQPRSFGLLNNVARVILAHPEIPKVRVEGHTDSRGDEAYNQGLSERRAASVALHLIQAGVPPERLESVGYGESQPIADNETAAGRQENRRVEFTFVR